MPALVGMTGVQLITVFQRANRASYRGHRPSRPYIWSKDLTAYPPMKDLTSRMSRRPALTLIFFFT